ncbi:MAG: hypothetical protein ACE5Z5_00405 [Candidatus Bathyarchaeia archaeon]
MSELILGLFVLISAGLFLLTLFFATTYHKRLSQAQKEYEDSRDLVRGIVLTFRRRHEEHTKKIDNLAYGVEAARSDTERLMGLIQQQQNLLKRLQSNIKSSSLADKRLAQHLVDMRKAIDALKANQQDLQKQLAALEEKYRGMLPEIERTKGIPVDERSAIARLTETERRIIQLLIAEGPKSAPEIEQNIRRTREHTSRLMKKLFEEGYVDRDTHTVPYLYRVNEKLKKAVKTKA